MTIFLSIQRLMRAERGLAKLARLLLRISERASGRWRAYVAGWPHGSVGTGARIMGSAHIHVGNHCSVGRHAWIEVVIQPSRQAHQARIDLGERFCASERLHIACVNKVVFGVDCLLGSSVHITDHNHGSYKGAMQSSPGQAPISRALVSGGAVEIGNRVWIGDNCVIVGPAQIGDGSIVGANSVVTGPVPAGVIVAGVPARIIKSFNSLNGQWEPVSHRQVAESAKCQPPSST